MKTYFRVMCINTDDTHFKSDIIYYATQCPLYSNCFDIKNHLTDVDGILTSYLKIRFIPVLLKINKKQQT